MRSQAASAIQKNTSEIASTGASPFDGRRERRRASTCPAGRPPPTSCRRAVAPRRGQQRNPQRWRRSTSRPSPAECRRRLPCGCDRPPEVAIAAPPIRIHISGAEQVGRRRLVRRPPEHQTRHHAVEADRKRQQTDRHGRQDPDPLRLSPARTSRRRPVRQPPRARSRRPVHRYRHIPRAPSAAAAASRAARPPRAATSPAACRRPRTPQRR